MKKFKSIIIVLLIVPMLMLSYNQKKAEAIVGVDDVVMVGGVLIATSVIVSLMIKAGETMGYNPVTNYGTDLQSYLKTKILAMTATELAKYFFTASDGTTDYVATTDDGYDYSSNEIKADSSSSSYIPITSTQSTVSNTSVSSSLPFTYNGFTMYPYSYQSSIYINSFKLGYGNTIKLCAFLSSNPGSVMNSTFTPTNDCYIRVVTTSGYIRFQYSYDNSSWNGMSITNTDGTIYCIPNVSSSNSNFVSIGYSTSSNTVYVPGNQVITSGGSTTTVSNDASVATPISGQYSSDGTTKVYDGIEGASANVIGGLTAKDLSTTTTTNSTEIDNNYDIKINVGSIDRIFNNKQGHLTSNTAENRKILEDVANYEGNYIGMDYYENEWYTGINSDGTQIWVEVTNGEIVNGGINEFPIKFDVQSVNNIDDTTIEDTDTVSTTSAAIKPEFRNQDLFDEHFDKHVIKKKEFGNMTKDEYLEGAQDLVASEPGGDILMKTRTNGDKIFYNKTTNELAVTNKSDNIKTYFKPKNGIDYYNNQK